VIVVDTSALMAIALNEPLAPACARVLANEREVRISAGTLAEALIVARRRNAGGILEELIEGLGIEILPVTAAVAGRMADAYDRWGKGVHPAGLNLGDCFAYAAAQEQGCPLLFVGDDFSRTDLEGALG
jgi:ribonuclease VapC